MNKGGTLPPSYSTLPCGKLPQECTTLYSKRSLPAAMLGACRVRSNVLATLLD